MKVISMTPIDRGNAYLAPPIPSPGEVVMDKSNNRIQLWHLQEVASEVQWNGKPTAGRVGNTEHNYGIFKHKILPAQIELLIYYNYLF